MNSVLRLNFDMMNCIVYGTFYQIHCPLLSSLSSVLPLDSLEMILLEEIESDGSSER